jgi:putative hydrolase of the HAD superfamily
LKNDYDVKIDLEAFRALAHKFWSSSPAFDDVKPFFEKCPLPIYIITNNGEEYVSAFLKNNGLHCAGIVCGDMVKAYKPRKELFGKALEISGCASHEVIHVGDSLQSDVQGAMSVGIKACLLDRKAANTPANTQEGYVVCSSLTETLTLL